MLLKQLYLSLNHEMCIRDSIWLAYTCCPDNLFVIGLIAPAVSGFMAFYTLLFVIRQLKQDGTERQKELTPRRV